MYLYDNKDDVLLDACSAKADASNIGQCIFEIGDLLSIQSKKISLFPSHFFSFDTVEYYLKNLVSFAPNGFERTWITISGRDANGAQINGNWC